MAALVALRSTAVVALPSVDAVTAALARPLLVAGVWAAVALSIGTLLVLLTSPDLDVLDAELRRRGGVAFTVGFLAILGPLSLATGVLLLASVSLPEGPAAAIGAVAGLATLVLVVPLAVAGTCLGLVLVGDRVAAPVRDVGPCGALAAGVAVLAPTQLVPILGVLVTLALATVGGGLLLVRTVESQGDRVIGPGPPGRDEAAVTGPSLPAAVERTRTGTAERQARGSRTGRDAAGQSVAASGSEENGADPATGQGEPGVERPQPARSGDPDDSDAR